MKIIIDINKLNIEKHDYLKQIFNLPDYYGNNLDAFYDCITDINKLEIEYINKENSNEFSKQIINILNK